MQVLWFPKVRKIRLLRIGFLQTRKHCKVFKTFDVYEPPKCELIICAPKDRYPTNQVYNQTSKCQTKYKLDGVGPVDNRPSTNKLHHFVKKRTKKMWHMTCDTCHVTRDMWHVTRDTWHVTRLGGWTFFKNFSSLALTVCDLWYYEDLEEKDELMNELMN